MDFFQEHRVVVLALYVCVRERERGEVTSWKVRCANRGCSPQVGSMIKRLQRK